MQLDYITQVKILSFICIAVGIHGLIHLGAEVNYNYNPLQLINKKIEKKII